MAGRVGLAFVLLTGLLLSGAVAARAAEVGYWPFDEGSGATAFDASGSGNDGTLAIDSSAWVPGVFGTALDFPSNGHRVVIPDSPSLDISGPITIAAWIRPTRRGTQYAIKKARYNEVDGYEIGLSSSSGSVFVRFNQVSAGNTYKVLATTQYPTDGTAWMHVAATFDGNEIRLYVDGALERAVSAPGLVIHTNDASLALGAEDDGSSAFDGSIDEVHIFDHALSESDVQALMSGGALGPDTDGDGVADASDAFPLDPGEAYDADGDGTGDNADPDDDDDGMPDAWEVQFGFDPFDPADAGEDADGDGLSNLAEYLGGTDPRHRPGSAEVGAWSLDEGSGALVADSSGLGNDGAVVGSSSWVAGVHGSALAFPGDGSHVLVPHDPSLEPGSELTLALWVRPNTYDTQYLLKKARYDSVDGFELSLSSSSQVAFARFNQASAGNTYKVMGHTPYPRDGQTWMHAAVTFDGQAIRLYIDGALDAEQAAPGLVIAHNGLDLALGAEDDGSSGLDGALDDVRIFDKALSAAEIETLMAGGPLLPDPDRDGDGVADADDAFPDDPGEWLDSDGDGIGDNADLDDDGDGMPDAWELLYGFDPLDPTDAGQDADGDGRTNLDEFLLGTDPRDGGDGGGADPAVGIWGFDEASGSSVVDASGLGQDGTIVGSAGRVPGVYGSGLDFGGTGGRVLVPDAAPLDLRDGITLLLWLRPRREATQYVLKKARYGETDGYEIGLSESTGSVFVRFNQASAGNTYKVLSAARYPTDGATWIHVAASFDGQEIRVYANGVLEAVQPATGLQIGTNDLALSIGAQDDGTAGFDGTLDDVRIYDRALSEAEIDAVMGEGPPPDSDGDGVVDPEDAFPSDPSEWLDSDGDGIGDNADPDDDGDGMPDAFEQLFGFDPLDPSDAAQDADGDGTSNLDEYLQGTDPRNDLVYGNVATWLLDEGLGSVAHDVSGYGNDGTLVGQPEWIPGGGLDFPGPGDRVLVDDHPTLDMSRALTLAAWIRPEATADQVLIAKAREGAVDGYELGLNAAGRIFVRFNEASEGAAFQLVSTSSYPAGSGAWMHVAATFDGQDIRLYLDGVLEDVLAAPDLWIGQNDLPLSLGARDDGGRPYDGALDHVVLYDTALSGGEIQALVAEGEVPGLDQWSEVALSGASTSTTSGEKPQSKVWRYAGSWWAVFPDSSGTWLRRLDGLAWTPVLFLSSNSSVQADYEMDPVTGVVHLLLFDGDQSQLASVEYVPGSPGSYQPWSARPTPTDVPLESVSETGTLALDGTGRLWVAYDGSSKIKVRYADPDDDYSSWSGSIDVASGVQSDDIGAIVKLPGRVGVMWSNQNSERFGFRTHQDGASPSQWSSDEVPASQSAENVGGGMADDHIHMSVGSDGTLYAAVKTSYDTSGHPRIAMLVRRPNGSWDDLYTVDTSGTRPIVVLNEATREMMVIYTSSESGGSIRYKTSSIDSIGFGSRHTLMSGSYNDAMSTEQHFIDELVVIAATDSGSREMRGALFAP